MVNRVFIKDQSVSLSPRQAIGKGGEADIYNIGNGLVLKVFKPPDHPDYAGEPHEQQGARERIKTHQLKLPAFPKNLPSRVITPIDLAYDQSNHIAGYTMRFMRNTEVLLRYAEKSFRQAGVSNDTVTAIFRDLHPTVDGIHKAGAIIGDFNDLNVLVSGTEAYVIDADSFQFGKFLTRVFTARFVDPLLCDPHASSPMLSKPHTASSDWYAYVVMLMQCLLFVDPYGGVYNPKDPKKRLPHMARPLHRITVFHPEVKYPKPAIPYQILPDELLHFFHQTFEKDQRDPFPLILLEKMRWTKCIACGTEHARSICPSCAHVAEAAIKEVTVIRDNVKATRVFRTDGVILFAAYQGNKLNYLYNEKGQFKREDGSVVIQGDPDPQSRYRINGSRTLVAKGGQILTFSPSQPMERLQTDCYGTLPIFDANEHSRYWTTNGQLLRDGQLGAEYVGDVLEDQTLFWVGPKFGFGFYRAGNLSVAFVFDANRAGINDNVKLPRMRGQLVDSTCVFGKDRCWFFYSTSNRGKITNYCSIVRSDGTVEASGEAENHDGSWLGTIRGKCAASNFLLAATDDGIVKVEPNNGQIVITKEFPNSEPFVDSQSNLFPGVDGLYVVGKREIVRLVIT